MKIGGHWRHYMVGLCTQSERGRALRSINSDNTCCIWRAATSECRILGQPHRVDWQSLRGSKLQWNCWKSTVEMQQCNNAKIQVTITITFLTLDIQKHQKRHQKLHGKTAEYYDRTNWWYSTFKPPKWLKIGPRLLLITSRKSNTRFSLITEQTIIIDPNLNDLEWPLCTVTLHLILLEPP